MSLDLLHAPLIGMGAMRLSAAPPDRARATLTRALAAGVSLLDTADVYGLTDADRHGNERWLASFTTSSVLVATKGGLVRGLGRWRPDGRAKALSAACAGSRAALGVDRIALYQLHAPDPRTLSTSGRALARLKADGWVDAVGLCNVTVDQLREVQRHVKVESVQVALSPFDGGAIRSGVIEYAQQRGVRVIAHSPFGGASRARRIERDPVLARLAAHYGTSPYAVALAWLYDLSIIPLPGPTRPEHVDAIVTGAQLSLSVADRKALDERFPLGAWLRSPRAARRPPNDAAREVVIVMGMPAAGKTTAVADYVERGYVRFNRDEAGCTMTKLHRRLDAFLTDGEGHAAVLDNTYPTRAVRHEVLEVAWKHGCPVRCVWIDTPLEQAQVNAVHRLWTTFDGLPEPETIRSRAKKDPQVFGPEVQLRFQRVFEPPDEEEGFSAIERRAFEARTWPSGGRSATLVAEDVLSSVWARLTARKGPIVVVAWWPGVSDHDRRARIAKIQRQGAGFGREVAVFACTHAPTERCWCLLPLPGLGYSAVATFGLNPHECLWLGRGSVHRRAAAALAIPFAEIEGSKS